MSRSPTPSGTPGRAIAPSISATDGSWTVSLEELETPVPVVDLDRLDRNLDRMAEYTRAHGLALRPHTKTHKSIRVAQEQVHRGAIGLTCATPREAEVMASVSQDLLLAYPPVGEARLRRLMALPDHVRLSVALDSRESADQLARAGTERGRTTGVYVEVDLGMHRVGIARAEDMLQLIAFVSERPSLSYRGIAFYPGHIRTLSAGKDELDRLASNLQNTIRTLDDAGLSPAVVSGGSTPTVWESHRIAGLTEIRPGTYVYNDRITAQAGACDWNDCALTVLATVVSTAVPGQAVVDAGSKSLGREPSGSVESGFGSLLDRPEVVVAKLSEEHGILDLRGTGWRPAVGDRVRIVPNHVCIAVHLHELIYGVRGEQIQTSWPVAARGRLQADRISP